MDAKSVGYRAPVRGVGGFGKKGVICTFWLQGRCNRNPCRFVHGAMALPTRYTYHRTVPYPQVSKQASREDRLNSKKSSHTNRSHLYSEESSISYGAAAKKDTRPTCDVGHMNGTDESESHQDSQESSSGTPKNDNQATCEDVKNGGATAEKETQPTCDVGHMNGTGENDSHQYSREQSSGAPKNDNQATCKNDNQATCEDVMNGGAPAEKETQPACDVGHMNGTDENESQQQYSQDSSSVTAKNDARATCEDVMNGGAAAEKETQPTCDVGHMNGTDENESQQYSQDSSSGTPKNDSRATCEDVMDGGHKKTSTGVALPVCLKNAIDENESHQYPQESSISSGGISKKDAQATCNDVDKPQCLHSFYMGDGVERLAELEGHKKAITGIAFPVGSQQLYTGSGNGVVRAWDCHTGQCESEQNLGSEIGSLISAGPWMFVGLRNVIRVGNAQTSAEYILDAPFGQVYALETSGKDMLFAGMQDGSILVWKYDPEADAFQLITNLKGHTGCVLSLKVGKQSLYSGSMDNTIRKWDLDTLQCSQTLSGHSAAVTSLFYWESFLFSCSLDRAIKAWTITEAGCVEAIHTHNEAHGVLALFGMFDADNKAILFSSLEDNSVHLYELPSFIERGKIFGKQKVETIESGPGGLFFTGDGAGGVAVWRFVSQKKTVDAA